MKAFSTIAGAALLLLAPAALAAEGDALSSEYRLTEAEKEKLLAEAVAKREASEELLPPAKRKVHGEVGVAVGTGGFRSIYGTSAVPLGEDGIAIISVENTDFGRQYPRHRRRY